MTATAQKPPPDTLAKPLSALAGVGPARAAQLAKLDVHTIEDLLLYAPRRYENRRQFRPIAELEVGAAVMTRGKIVAQGVKWFHHHEKSIFEIILDDGTGRLHCRWWNLPFMEKYFSVGHELVVFGKLLSRKPRNIDHPETEIVEANEENSIHLNRITPIYPLTEGLQQRWLRALLWRTLIEFGPHITEPWTAPPDWRPSSLPFPSRAKAVRDLHFPEALADADAARRRLAFDEFVSLQRQIQLRRRNFESKAPALPCAGDNRLIKPFLAQLGFRLTEAQTRVLRELRHDLAGPLPMRRLLQGDVGSGKTVVAACCALMALESTRSVALMAPTEVLAEQHYRTFKTWFEPLGVPVELQTGSRSTAQSLDSKVQSLKSKVQLQPPPSPHASRITHHDSPLTHYASLFIGTHALITPGFDLPNLGLVIIDEQHKFGVAQREQLVRKGQYPHLLVMTATPIPRTLGLTMYGELDSSIIDQSPPGRGVVKTFVRAADKLPKVWAFVRDKLGEGRQAYVVYPRVEETSQNGIKAVSKEFENLARILAPFKIGLVHGRLRSRDKEIAMEAFRKNGVQALLATSLIEVGVDVPNATIMVVENAEQFGLAQLHQLRGRIGRGAHESYCILIAAAKGSEARRRLKVLEETNDGFQIAEADLRLRGPGELLGREQSGLPKFRFGNLEQDLDLILQARELVAKMG